MSARPFDLAVGSETDRSLILDENVNYYQVGLDVILKILQQVYSAFICLQRDGAIITIASKNYHIGG
jgi:hypothetical protein